MAISSKGNVNAPAVSDLPDIMPNTCSHAHLAYTYTCVHVKKLHTSSALTVNVADGQVYIDIYALYT